MLESGRLKLSFKGMSVPVPHPANFALHKLLISARRSESYKRENDRRQALKLIDDLIDNDDSDSLSSVFSSLSVRWQIAITAELSILDRRDIIILLTPKETK